MPMTKIYRFFVKTKLFESENARRAIFQQAGLEDSLISQIDTSGSTMDFVAHCLDKVALYGDLSDGRNAFRALMDAVQSRLGIDWKPEIEAVITEFEKEKIGRGIEGFAKMMRDDRALLKSALRFRVIFETARTQSAIVASYKEIHDQLDDLQILCYERLADEMGRLTVDAGAPVRLREHSRQLQRIVNKLTQIAQDVGAEIGWIGDLTRLRSQLDNALLRADLAQLDEIKQDLRDILETQPTDINRRLVDAATNLRLPTLIAAIESVISNRGQGGDTRLVAHFEAGLIALGNLSTRLLVLIDEHNKWQDIDRRLRLIESDLVASVDQLESSWRQLRPRVEILCLNSARWAQNIGSTEDWATCMIADIGALQSAIEGHDLYNERSLFRGFRDRAGDRFLCVDKALKRLCTEELRPIGERLDAVLEVMA